MALICRRRQPKTAPRCIRHRSVPGHLLYYTTPLPDAGGLRCIPPSAPSASRRVPRRRRFKAGGGGDQNFECTFRVPTPMRVDHGCTKLCAKRWGVQGGLRYGLCSGTPVTTTAAQPPVDEFMWHSSAAGGDQQRRHAAPGIAVYLVTCCTTPRPLRMQGGCGTASAVGHR